MAWMESHVLGTYIFLQFERNCTVKSVIYSEHLEFRSNSDVVNYFYYIEMIQNCKYISGLFYSFID